MKIGTGHSNLPITHTFTRAKGFPYWTYSCVRQSSCGVRFELGDRVTIARGPCVILIRPGTAYRLSYAGTGRRWIEDYALFAPRAEWLRLMDWPALVPEIGCLQLDRSPASRNYIRALADL